MSAQFPARRIRGLQLHAVTHRLEPHEYWFHNYTSQRQFECLCTCISMNHGSKQVESSQSGTTFFVHLCADPQVFVVALSGLK